MHVGEEEIDSRQVLDICMLLHVTLFLKEWIKGRLVWGYWRPKPFDARQLSSHCDKGIHQGLD